MLAFVSGVFFGIGAIAQAFDANSLHQIWVGWPFWLLGGMSCLAFALAFSGGTLAAKLRR